jgi:Lipase (class 3)
MFDEPMPMGDFTITMILMILPAVIPIILIALFIWADRILPPSPLRDWFLLRTFQSSVILFAITLTIGPLWFFWPHFNQKEPEPTIKQIHNSQDLAKFVFSQYSTLKPICITAIENLKSSYLVTFSGTELDNPVQATNVTEDIVAASAVEWLSPFIGSVKKALESYRASRASSGEPENLILAGHSLGGMEAEIIAADHELLGNYHIFRLITFGKPKTRALFSDPGIARHFVIVDDPVVKWVDRLIFFVREKSPGTIVLPPTNDKLHSEHSNYPVSDDLTLYDGIGDRIVNGHPPTSLVLALERVCSEAENPKYSCAPGRVGCGPTW